MHPPRTAAEISPDSLLPGGALDFHSGPFLTESRERLGCATGGRGSYCTLVSVPLSPWRRVQRSDKSRRPIPSSNGFVFVVLA
jgi:hypothetical protein